MTNKHNVAPSHEMVLAELAPMDGSLWKLVLHPLEFKRDKNPDLTPLLNQPGAKNPFFDPAFLMASRDRMADTTL